MSENITKLMNEKRQIYDKILELLELHAKKSQQGGSKVINWNANILGDIYIGNANNSSHVINRLTQISNELLTHSNNITLTQAMDNSFSRILNK